MADQYQKLVADPVTLPSPSPSLFAGGFPRQQETVIILTGQPALPRGTALAKSGSKYIAVVQAALDATATPVGILGIATDAATADVTAFMYTSGDFNIDMVVDSLGAVMNATSIATLKALHIELKKVTQ